MSSAPLKRIVFTGPESTGKTTLAKACSAEYGAIYVPEAARYMIDEMNSGYQYADLLKFAREQFRIQQEALKNREHLVFQDTDLLTIRIWSLSKFGKCEDWIDEIIREHQPDLYFLCGIDWPWVEDPQREDRQNREELYHFYLRELNNLKVRHIKLVGSFEERMSEIKKNLY